MPMADRACVRDLDQVPMSLDGYGPAFDDRSPALEVRPLPGRLPCDPRYGSAVVARHSAAQKQNEPHEGTRVVSSWMSTPKRIPPGSPLISPRVSRGVSEILPKAKRV